MFKCNMFIVHIVNSYFKGKYLTTTIIRHTAVQYFKFQPKSTHEKAVISRPNPWMNSTHMKL